MGSLLHILFGTVFRAVTPKATQNAVGAVLFWLVGMPLLLATFAMIGWLLWMAATHQTL